ncbi:MAG: hypothetical protein ABR962_02785 [Candidatus Bathyarchaeia archaeon]|jgi:Arc/MetJ-type ribon-helix-helix transcriptional regulator
MTRKPITITIPPKCLEWLDKQVDSRRYDTRSHGVELLILGEMRKEEADKSE